MSEDQRGRSNELLVGSIIIASIALAVFGTLWMKGVGFTRETQVFEAVFREVGQLKEGNAVTFRGVNVGQVEEISVEPGGGAIRAFLRVRNDLELPTDPGVVIAPENFFGDWQAEIVPTARYPRFTFLNVGDPSTLPGFTIPDISRLTASADQIAENLNTISERFELAFTEETALNLKRAIDNFTQVTDDLSDIVGEQGDKLGDVTTEFQRVLEDVGSAARSAEATFDDLGAFIGDGAVDSVLVDTRAAVRSLREASGDLETTMASIRTASIRADSTFSRIDRITAMIESGEGSIARLLSDSTMVVRFEDVLLRVDSLLADFQKNPRRYIKLSIF